MKKSMIVLIVALSQGCLYANAQVVHNVCAGGSIVLHLSTPTSASVQWQHSTDNVSFFPVPGGTHDSLAIMNVSSTVYYRAQITGSNCNPFFSEVRKVNVLPLPVLSITNLNGSYCQSDGPVALTGVPAGGTFSGTGISGTVFHPGTAGVGNHTVTYLFTDSNACSNTVSQPVAVVAPPTQANAGPDITAAGLTIAMAANAPLSGSGQWSIAAGTGGSFATATSNTSNFTGASNQVYALVWTISNPPCARSRDTVIVTMPTGPTLPWVSCGSPAYTMYVHPTDNAGPTAWGCIGIVAGAGDDNNGALNTTTIVQVCGSSTAAFICDNLVAYGYSDWYLPSYNELECVRLNAASIGGFSQGSYWSSTEGTGIFTANARYRTFPTGVSGYGSKSNTNRIRCVRKDATP